jgi:membrane protease YdiL (CAAX protease family)
MFEPNSTIGWPIGRLRSTARELIAFVRAPTPDARATGQDRRAADVAWLFLLNCLVVLAIAMVLFPIMIAFGVEMSNDMSALFNLPFWQVMLIVVLVGPVTEELIFRAWIVGTARWLVLFAGLVAWMGGSYLLTELGLMASEQSAAIALIAIILVATLIGLIRFWKSSVPDWYVRIFPLIFWAQALLFGFVHVFNYAGDNPLAVLPFVLPQMVGGLIWGYARVRYGWWSNIIMHMAYNFLAISGLLYMLLAGKGGI